jgi:hypothetical protein
MQNVQILTLVFGCNDTHQACDENDLVPNAAAGDLVGCIWPWPHINIGTIISSDVREAKI